MFKEKIIAIAMALLLATSLSACSDNTQADVSLEDTELQPGFTVVDENGSEYSLVRGENADATTVSSAVKLRKKIEEVTGIKLGISTDFEKENTSFVRREREILVGNTNRDESLSLYPTLGRKDFLIDFGTTRISILGGSGEATEQAVDYFIENYLFEQSKAVAIDEGTHYRYTHVFPEIAIAGKPIQDYVIVSHGIFDDVAQKIKASIFNVTDKSLEIVSEASDSAPSIVFEIDSTLAPCVYKAYVKDGNLFLASSTANGIAYCSELIEKEINQKKPEELFGNNYEITEEYNVKSITETEAAIKHFIANTDKNPLEYAVGEEITFNIALYADNAIVSCPKFKWSIAGDDGQKSGGFSDGKSGELTLTADCGVAGAVRVTVTACDENGNALEGVDVFDGGALAGFENIQLGSDDPEDFDSFWKKQRNSLNSVKPVLISSEPVLEGITQGFEVYDVRVSMGDADPVSGYLSYPVGAEPGSLKIRATFMGYGVNSASKTCLDGCITFAVNSHSIVNGETPEFYEKLRAEKFPSYGFIASENSDPETVYFKKMLLRDIQAIRFLMESELWNGEDIELSGGSQGAFQTIAVAAIMNDKVTKISAGIPWMVDLGGIRLGRMRGWRPDYTDAMAYYDTANFAKRVKCPAYIDAGLGDYICPPSGIAAMYNAMTCPKKLTFIQNRTHGYYPKNVISFVMSDGIEEVR